MSSDDTILHGNLCFPEGLVIPVSWPREPEGKKREELKGVKICVLSEEGSNEKSESTREKGRNL